MRAGRFSAVVVLAVLGSGSWADAAHGREGDDSSAISRGKKDQAPAAAPAPVAAVAAPKRASASGRRTSDQKRTSKAPEAKRAESAPARPSDAKSVESAAPVHEDVGPGPGQGERKIATPSEAKTEAQKTVPETDAEGSGKSVHKGKPPKRPSATLPDGATKAPMDDDGRRQIAGGATADELDGDKPDPELRELRDAERVLFPKPLRGGTSPWSWEYPAPVDGSAPTIVASGLPPTFPLPAERPDAAAKDAAFLQGLSSTNLPVHLDQRVVTYLKFYRDDPRGKSILRTWAKKCGRLAPALRAELAKAGLPTDLVWLSLIESGHNPTIVSPAGAAGLWQFIPESARLYGLTVDRWVDERLDPERSTFAAVRYLADLRTRFGSWELAMAAYNMGHGGLLRAMRKYNTNDFWALTRYEAGLPWETTLYVPKIVATAIAMTNKKAFGIDDVEQDAPLSFDTVTVPPGTDLSEVARAADTTPEDIRALNAHYVSGRTPPSDGTRRGYPVKVPAGRGLVAEQRLAQGPKRAGSPTEPHVVRYGDTVETIALEHGATVRDVAQLNHVSPDERLAPGTVVLVPLGPDGATRPSPDDEEVVVVPARRFADASKRRVFYRIVQGDQLPEIAARLGTTPAELAAWNAIDPAAQVQAGMTLQAFVRADLDLSRIRVLGEHEVRVLVAGSGEFFEYFEAQNGRKRVTLTAKKGDTFVALARKYGMSFGLMERVNRVPIATPLSPGDRVVVYTKGEAPASAPDVDQPKALSAVVAPLPDVLPAVPAGTEATQNGKRAVVP
ncbi:MAG TPA: LysM peptidoglycan-binding domain-containing protein [Polyangiaceae bacterium]|nr:LysM peptidoglycan-binding domain-containing protein [Polyangiaceae bacterium]